MLKSRWLVTASVCSLIAMPAISNAQAPDSTKEHAQDFVHDVLRALIGPNWNLFAHGGFATDDRFVLQRSVDEIGGERALQSSTGFNVGGGAGVDILLRTGFRLSYTYTSNKLNFKTNNGNGSDELNIDDVGTLKSHTAALEVIHYMLSSRAAITPYGTLGIKGTWWVLDQKSPLVTSDGASTPFTVAPLVSFGVQFKATDQFSGRLETALTSGRNPFTGKKSFRANSGPTIDEPTGVSHTDFRVAGVYHFGRQKLPKGDASVARK